MRHIRNMSLSTTIKKLLKIFHLLKPKAHSSICIELRIYTLLVQCRCIFMQLPVTSSEISKAPLETFWLKLVFCLFLECPQLQQLQTLACSENWTYFPEDFPGRIFQMLRPTSAFLQHETSPSVKVKRVCLLPSFNKPYDGEKTGPALTSRLMDTVSYTYLL